ncbi:alpha/beta fold hydrolase [Neolewinella antarctica]|uniref:Pimeloyl-ACP methyl ester carboxylesterase n=1 Tax=Neolewinella antarctica TaxID=442734 RepID=A0ABX0X8T8_9BACT|nr:alpha/beta fold hydrolase [Neolewinella antarctica]NJC25673.1 pimeloyl-ACP methyl ester carboxylesterase [Neolewinella antarctica]
MKNIIITLLVVAYGTTLCSQTQDFLSRRSNESIVKTQALVAEVQLAVADTTKLQSVLTNKSLNDGIVHFPYPIMFIHGLNSNSNTWLQFYTDASTQGWDFGGEILFNLNSDNNDEHCNLYEGALIDVVDFNNPISPGDFYAINFNTDIRGNSYGDNYDNPFLSNQAAIFKQAWAVRNAIARVLAVTGRDKVILAGHSMGGLAARAYLQNESFHQADGQHHVAKLMTTGTPHGGSNSSGYGLGPLFSNIDERSDAVRDLRSSYSYSNSPGVFLFGGVETASVLNDHLIGGFYNNDVGCDGASLGFIKGLNQQSPVADIDYSCITGNGGLGINSDGVVLVTNAQINNFLDVAAETFNLTSETLIFHNELPTLTEENFRALDEPDYSRLAYEIQLDTVYNGYMNVQANDAEYNLIDYDDFALTVAQDSWVQIIVDSPADLLGLGITVGEEDVIFNEEFSVGEYTQEPIFLRAGRYTVEFYSYPRADEWQNSYGFLFQTVENPTSTQDLGQDRLAVYPNPVSDRLGIKLASPVTGAVRVSVTDVSGRQVINYAQDGYGTDMEVAVSALRPGVYVVRVMTQAGVYVAEFIKR